MQPNSKISNQPKRGTTKKVQNQSQNSSGIEKLQNLRPLRESNHLRTSFSRQLIEKNPSAVAGQKESHFQTIRAPSQDAHGRPKTPSAMKSNQRTLMQHKDSTLFESLQQLEVSLIPRHLRKISAGGEGQKKFLALLGNDKGTSFISTAAASKEKAVEHFIIKNKKVRQMAQKPAQLLQTIETRKQSQGASSKTRQDRYATVQSKVKKNLRSKTPKSKGALLSKQQLLENQFQRTIRHDQIIDLENHVQQIQHDLEFKQTNKDQILQSYRKQERNNQDKQEEVPSRLSLTSKRQFTDFEYLVQNHKFTNKYFDKVYLEICGFKDLASCKSDFLETQKQSNSVFCPPISRDLPLQETQQLTNDITGSATFFESRADRVQEQVRKNSTKLGFTESQNIYTDEEQLPIQAEAFTVDTGNQSFFENEADSPTEVRVLRDPLNDSKTHLIEIEKQEIPYQPTPMFQSYLQRQKGMQEENQRLEQDFETLQQEIRVVRKSASNMAFYEALNEHDYQKKSHDNLHHLNSFNNPESPTKRLIGMKNSQVEHIRQIKESNLLVDPSQAQVYVTSPDKTYIVQQNSQIDYNLAYKQPLKFQEEVLKGSISKHKIQSHQKSVSPFSDKKNTLKPNSSSKKSYQAKDTLSSMQKKKRKQKENEAITIVSKQNTVRPHNTINQKIKQRIEQKLADQFGAQLTLQVLKAIEEANLQDDFQDIIQDQKIQEQMFKPSSKNMSVKSLRNQQNERLDDDEYGTHESVSEQKRPPYLKDGIRVYMNEECQDQLRKGEYFA